MSCRFETDATREFRDLSQVTSEKDDKSKQIEIHYRRLTEVRVGM